jgi:hypothetical protein
VAGMARELCEGVRTEGFGPVLQQGLYEFTFLSSYCEMNSKNVSISNTYSRISGGRGLKFAPLAGGARRSEPLTQSPARLRSRLASQAELASPGSRARPAARTLGVLLQVHTHDGILEPERWSTAGGIRRQHRSRLLGAVAALCPLRCAGARLSIL